MVKEWTERRRNGKRKAIGRCCILNPQKATEINFLLTGLYVIWSDWTDNDPSDVLSHSILSHNNHFITPHLENFSPLLALTITTWVFDINGLPVNKPVDIWILTVYGPILGESCLPWDDQWRTEVTGGWERRSGSEWRLIQSASGSLESTSCDYWGGAFQGEVWGGLHWTCWWQIFNRWVGQGQYRDPRK